MTQHFDVIIIGSGPNGLAIGAYLSRAGQRVLLLEKRFEAGGGLATEQVTLPEYYHNTHAIYKMMVDYAPVYRDFALEEKYGVDHIQPELQVAMPLEDGRCLCIHRDLEKSCQSIAEFSPKDAESYRDMHHRFDEMMKHILGPQTYVPMEGALEMAAQAEMTELGREVSTYAEKSPQEIVCDLFEDDQVRTLMLYMACHWGLEYDQAGVSYMVPVYLNRMANYRLTAGGSHRVSNALLKSIFEHQGQIRTGAQIRRILVEGGEARGVELEDGTQLLAEKAVVSTIDLHQTFLEYVGEGNLDPQFADSIRAWEWEEWSLCNLHLALAEPPRFRAAESQPEIDRALIYVLGYQSMDDLTGHWEAMRKGQIPAGAGCNGCFPSVHDSFQAPPGRATGLLPDARGGQAAPARHPAAIRSESLLGQGAVDLPHHAGRHPEQVHQHGPGKLQAGRVPALPDGIPPPQPGVLPLSDAGREALSRRSERRSGGNGHLRARLQLLECHR
jgi:phytoene dehydrogenase-like protein